MPKDILLNLTDLQAGELLELVRQRITFCYRWAAYHEHHRNAEKQTEWFEEAKKWEAIDVAIEAAALQV